MTKLPDGPWKQLSMDISGPFENKYYLLAVIDYYSRFPLVEVLTSTTCQSIINHLRKRFSIFGYPEEIRSDNAPNMEVKKWNFSSNKMALNICIHFHFSHDKMGKLIDSTDH